jgi:hypothetical protein
MPKNASDTYRRTQAGCLRSKQLAAAVQPRAIDEDTSGNRLLQWDL